MAVSDRTRSRPGHAPVCRRGCVPFSTSAPFNHGSEVPESAGLRPANYSEETLPTIGKVEGKQGSTAARRRDKASDALGIARHTAKFHLDKLAEEGLLDISFKRLSERQRPGAGRPTKLYARSSQQLSVILPERRYDLAAQLLAGAIDDATPDGTPIAVRGLSSGGTPAAANSSALPKESRALPRNACWSVLSTR